MLVSYGAVAVASNANKILQSWQLLERPVWLLVLITKTCLYFLVCRMFKNMFRFCLKNVTVTSSFMVQTLNIFFRQEAVYLELVTHRLV